MKLDLFLKAFLGLLITNTKAHQALVWQPLPPITDNFLVCHDYKSKDDAKAGYVLPRLGVIEAGKYTEVSVLHDDPIRTAKDLESLTWLYDKRYLVCESSGKCFGVDVAFKDGTYHAVTTQTMQLPVPAKPRFYNIESISSRQTIAKDASAEFCYDHRGGIYAGEEPWTHCTTFNLMTGEIDENITFPEDPFAISNPLNRAISDRAIGAITGETYFVATIDTEGSKGIAATDDEVYSFIYTKDQCIKHIPGDKVEGLHINRDETIATFTTDNDRPGSEKICTFSLVTPTAEPQCSNIPHGIGGLAPLTTPAYGETQATSTCDARNYTSYGARHNNQNDHQPDRLPAYRHILS